VTPDIIPMLLSLKTTLSNIVHWQKEAIHAVMMKMVTQHHVKLGKIAQPIRIAVTGSTHSPSLDITLQFIGKKAVLARLDQFLQKLSG